MAFYQNMSCTEVTNRFIYKYQETMSTNNTKNSKNSPIYNEIQNQF